MKKVQQVVEYTEYENTEVQIEGYGPKFDSSGNWCWSPGHGLPELEEGKELVVLYPCDCGCWNNTKQEWAVKVIMEANNPERFVLMGKDPRYSISRHGNVWRLHKR